ncbi:MAG: hypothetical protein HOI21_05360 [Bacteroidetes Order II. Incertae sedis bacterium]|jgi:hypothetical protein|nr:hypothetical protein [Bacteroidetes Order II. bacterium]
MPDLLTHAASGYLAGRCFYSDHRVGLVVFGSILPDLMTRVPGIILQRFLELPVAHFFAAFHTPTSLAVSCYGFSFLFAKPQRRLSFILMFSGSLLHFVLDLMQKQFYEPIYMPWFPLSLQAVQWSWFHIHASLLVAPILLIAVLWLWRKANETSNR